MITYTQAKSRFFGLAVVLGAVVIPTFASAQCPSNLNLATAYNIVPTDIPAQLPVVRKWIETNPYSGYPALVTKICTVMGNHKLKGDAPSLMVINHENLVLHKRQDSNPITNEDDIDPQLLRQAILDAWSQKNPGRISNATFKDIIR